MEIASELDVLKLVCCSLEKANIPYMLTGSFAANFYTIPRMTRDIDIVMEVTDCSVEKLEQIFDNEFYIEKTAIIDAIKYQGIFNIIHQPTVFKVDFIIRKDSPYRRIEFQRRIRLQLEGQSIWIVSPEDLIISKLIWAKDTLSEKQLTDIRNLLANLKSLDLDYLHHWIHQLELDQIYGKAQVEHA